MAAIVHVGNQAELQQLSRSSFATAPHFQSAVVAETGKPHQCYDE
jgi:hypothetical protein